MAPQKEMQKKSIQHFHKEIVHVIETKQMETFVSKLKLCEA